MNMGETWSTIDPMKTLTLWPSDEIVVAGTDETLVAGAVAHFAKSMRYTPGVRAAKTEIVFGPGLKGRPFMPHKLIVAPHLHYLHSAELRAAGHASSSEELARNLIVQIAPSTIAAPCTIERFIERTDARASELDSTSFVRVESNGKLTMSIENRNAMPVLLRCCLVAEMLKSKPN